MRHLLAAIDWRQPWFAPYRELGEAVTRRVAQGSSLAQALNAQCSTAGPGFVAPQEQGAEGYEAFVARTCSVPTRDNCHDFFNGLVWLRYPALKRRLNRLHAAELERHGVAATRGVVRDRLTLFDENGALFAGPPLLTLALQMRDWHRLFVVCRDSWRDAQLTIVGHALLEKLVQPRKAITAHVWLGECAHASTLPDPSTPVFAALPVLGVPGWWPGNHDPAFYVDPAVFRPAGSRRMGQSLP
jgi:hypothetical protein